MKIIRTIQFFFRKISWRRRTAPSFSFEVDKKPNKFLYALGVFTGFFYNFFQKERESLRILRRNQEQRKTEYSIPLQIIKYSKGIILFLVITLLLSIVFDFGIKNIFSSLNHSSIELLRVLVNKPDLLNLPDRNFIKLLLEISVGAISAILGLIFALYAVGFQLTTDKYSSAVSEYINQEVVSNFFFKFLVFTDLFSLITLIRVEAIKTPPFFSSILAIVLVIISLLGIIIFKNDYVVKLKPKSIFQRLWSDTHENIYLASNKNRFSYQSWNIIQNSRNRTQELLSLIQRVFEDLWQAQNWNDIIYTPTILSYILTDYAKRKKFIDKEKGWWFPQQQKEIKANDMASLSLKLNFELQGRGPLRIGSPDYLWFENRVFEIFKNIELRAVTSENKNNLLSNLIQSYQTILCGDYSKDKYGRYQKTTIGLYENQEIDAFEKYFDAYLEIYDKLKTDDEISAYLNGYFAIGLTLIDGFDYSKYQEIIKSLVGLDGQLTHTRDKLSLLDLPGVFYNQILDYWDRLDLEVQCEGRVVTPQNRLEKETLDDARSREKQYFDRYFEKLVTHHNSILKDLYQKEKRKELAMFIKARFEWISRLLYINKVSIADEYGAKIAGAGVYLPFLSKQILIDSEFWEEFEKLLFPAVIEDCQKLFKVLAGLLTLMLPVINADEKNIDNIMYRNRLSLILGAFVYLVCEFRQDYTLLIEYVQTIEVAYQQGRFIQAMEMLAKPKDVGGLDLTLKLINWETTRYHHWFSEIISQIWELPKTYDDVRFYSGMQEVANHPSKFIRELSYRPYQPEEECAEAFVEWVKKREVIRQLVEVLKKIQEKKI